MLTGSTGGVGGEATYCATSIAKYKGGGNQGGLYTILRIRIRILHVERVGRAPGWEGAKGGAHRCDIADVEAYLQDGRRVPPPATRDVHGR